MLTFDFPVAWRCHRPEASAAECPARGSLQAGVRAEVLLCFFLQIQNCVLNLIE